MCMKNIYIIISITIFIASISLFTVLARQSIGVSAVVGNANNSPVVISTNPSSNPKLLWKSKLQNYTLYFRDNEKDPVTYTITPRAGSSNILWGSISKVQYDSASGAYVTFTYLSPSSIPSPNPTSITITFNDGFNLVTKQLNVYVF